MFKKGDIVKYIGKDRTNLKHEQVGVVLEYYDIINGSLSFCMIMVGDFKHFVNIGKLEKFSMSNIKEGEKRQKHV